MVRVPDAIGGTEIEERGTSDSPSPKPLTELIVVPPKISTPLEEDISVKVRRCDGGSIKTVLSSRIIINEHSSLRREWITITDPLVPADLVDCSGLKTDYRHRTDYESGGYYFQAKYQLRAQEALTAFQVKFLTFDVWGDHIRTLVATEVRDLPAGQTILMQPEWSIFSENETSEFLASICFVSRVRTADGQVITTDTGPIMNEALRFSAKFKEADFEPTTKK